MTILIERLLLGTGLAALIWLIVRVKREVRRSPGPRAASDITSDPDAEEGGFGQRDSWANLTYRAGIPIPWFFFLIVVLQCSLLLGFVLWEQYDNKWPGILAVVVLPVATLSLLLEMARHRALRFEERLIHAIELMISSLRSGDTLRGALKGVSENGQPPVKEEFRKLIVKLELGFHIKRALTPMVVAYDSEGLRLFASSLTAKVSMGGNIIPVLESLSEVLRERHRFRIKVDTQLAGAKLAALMIALSPYLLLGLFWFYKRDWIERIFNHPNGSALFVGAVCLQLVGFASILRMQRMEL